MKAVLSVLYLIAVCAGVFLVRDPATLGFIGALQIVLWIAAGLGFAALRRQLRKLAAFSAFILACYALSATGGGADEWIAIGFVSVNLTGVSLGAWMIVRLVTVVLASQVVRASDPRAITTGLRKLGAPASIAAPLDVVLALGGGEPRGHGRGNGGGGGNGRGRMTGGFFAAVKRLSRGDVGAIVERVETQIDRAEAHAEQSLPESERGFARDAGVIAGIAATMLGIRALKVLPSIPFAPGHKLVLLNPLYVIASLRTRTRAGGTLTGLSMGIASFLAGDGRYGIFEIFKHVTPGVVCDVGLPLVVAGGRRPHPLVWALFGGVIAAGRFATIFAVTVAMQPPSLAWAILVPGLSIHVFFGVLSGWMTHHLVRTVPVPQPSIVHREIAK